MHTSRSSTKLSASDNFTCDDKMWNTHNYLSKDFWKTSSQSTKLNQSEYLLVIIPQPNPANFHISMWDKKKQKSEVSELQWFPETVMCMYLCIHKSTTKTTCSVEYFFNTEIYAS